LTLQAELNRPVPNRGAARKVWNRAQLLRILGSKRLMTHIGIDATGPLVIRECEWDEYWQQVKMSVGAKGKLEELEHAWRTHIDSGFDKSLLREYCLRYFDLLHTVTESRLACPEIEAAAVLRNVLAFETCGVSFRGQHDRIAAAATCTLRNPAYLLTKLKTPDVRDSPEHLPLVMPPQGPAAIYYHYRQHRLCANSDIALLLYLAVNHETRPMSFRTISALEESLSSGTDPFATERAIMLGRAGILEYLRAAAARDRIDPLSIELIDIGAGSGIVAARLCGEIIAGLSESGCRPRFRISFIDLALSQPSRFFASNGIRQYIDSIQVVGAEYRQWLEQETASPTHDGVRIGVASRFFNNLSDFNVRPCEFPVDCADLSLPPSRAFHDCMPIHCLSEDQPGPGRLIASNARIRTSGGRTFKQFSLSPYFHGLKLALESKNPVMHANIPKQAVFLPVRSFREGCLLTESGESLIASLMDRCDLLVIQDSDMSPDTLTAHLSSFHMDGLTALDTTRTVGLHGHSSCALGRRMDSAMNAVKGERIW
jgi:hypothetical protein